MAKLIQDLKASLDRLKASAVTYIQNASLEQLAELPERIFGGESDVIVAPNGGSTRRRIPTKPRRLMTRQEADEVRNLLSGLTKNSREYAEARDHVAREKGFTRRQIGSAVSGLDRAEKRKKPAAATVAPTEDARPVAGKSIESHINETRASRRKPMTVAQKKAIGKRMKKHWAAKRKAAKK